MKNGWIKLYRKIHTEGWYKDSHYVHLWIHILIKANHEEVEILWNGQMIKIKQGQFISGRQKLEQETGINQHKVDRILKVFETAQQIKQQKTNKFRLITVLKWKQYQIDEQQIKQQVSNKRATSEQQVSTNKKEKNEKNDKKLLSAKADEEWTFKSFLNEMDNHKRRDLQIMALYWKVKKIKFTNKAQAYDEIKRLLRPVKVLKYYEDEKISKTMDYLEKYADFKWSLETVRKFINEDLEKLKQKNGN